MEKGKETKKVKDKEDKVDSFMEYDELTEEEKKVVKNYITYALHKEKEHNYKKYIDLTPVDLYDEYVYFIKNNNLVDLRKKIKK